MKTTRFRVVFGSSWINFKHSSPTISCLQAQNEDTCDSSLSVKLKTADVISYI